MCVNVFIENPFKKENIQIIIRMICINIILMVINLNIYKNIDDYSKSLIRNESALKQSIKDVFDYSLTMRESAESLTKILKDDKKIRGNFGEMQLKSILESSGLIEGEHYKIQSSFKVENQTYIPDVVVYLDGGIEGK
ncbi:DNA recombination protein RmuC [Helicobacter typhlonius]